MNKIIDIDVLKERVNWMINDEKPHNLEEVLTIIETLENEAKKYEELKYKKDYEADLRYRQAIIKSVKNKRILPTFKGETLHKFKNELHTMKQIMGMSNWGDAQNALFDIFALAFATWGGYHFHPEETKTQDTPVIEN
jgi:hypothetical protein